MEVSVTIAGLEHPTHGKINDALTADTDARDSRDARLGLAHAQEAKLPPLPRFQYVGESKTRGLT